MQKNTSVLIIFLAVFAAIVVGVNLSRSFSSTPLPATPELPTITPTPELNQVQLLSYTDTICGISLQYPDTLTKVDIETGGATFIDPKETSNVITVVCQKEIPRVPLTQDKIDILSIGSVSANLYHDASQKDGTPVDKLIFTHPEKNIDVYLAGFGETFNQLIQSLTVNF